MAKARFSAIGSPLLNAIRKGSVGDIRRESCHSSCEGSTFGLTRQVLLVLKELAPRVWADHIPRLYCSDVTVSTSSFREMSDDLLVRTTCLIWVGEPPLKNVSEYWTSTACRASALLSGYPMMIRYRGKWSEERVYSVWTSPETFPRGQSRKQRHW